jgi:hypothetical protein
MPQVAVQWTLLQPKVLSSQRIGDLRHPRLKSARRESGLNTRRCIRFQPRLSTPKPRLTHWGTTNEFAALTPVSVRP